LNNALIKESIIENQKAVQKPETVNPGTILEARITNSAFITSEKIPRVSTVKGKVIIFINGLINIFITPKTTARTIAPVNVTDAPGRR
jgi:hypothetical protein